MNHEDIRQHCLSKPGVTEQFPFDDVTLVFKVLDKMFAILPLDDPEWLTLKCNPDRAILLRDAHNSILPAQRYFNQKYWNSLRFAYLTDSLLRELIDHSYDEVVKKMSKKAQVQLATLAATTCGN